MEHNILHSGIGIDEALGILQRFYEIDNIDIRGDPHQKYIAQMEADVEELEEGELEDPAFGDKLLRIVPTVIICLYCRGWHGMRVSREPCRPT